MTIKVFTGSAAEAQAAAQTYLTANPDITDVSVSTAHFGCVIKGTDTNPYEEHRLAITLLHGPAPE